jgi:hypothetical protein
MLSNVYNALNYLTIAFKSTFPINNLTKAGFTCELSEEVCSMCVCICAVFHNPVQSKPQGWNLNESCVFWTISFVSYVHPEKRRSNESDVKNHR